MPDHALRWSRTCALALAGLACVAAAADAVPAAEAAAGAVLGDWAREGRGCARPELSFGASTARIQTDADGSVLALAYAGVRYRADGHGRVTVELGRPHPYGKTASRSALDFRPQAADRIALVQGRRLVTFHRCSVVGGAAAADTPTQGASK